MDNAADLIRRALAVNYANLGLNNEVFVADGATFVRNTRFPDVYDSNHVAHITASSPTEIDRLFTRADREFAHTAHRSFQVDFTTPPALAARLTLAGYEVSSDLVMLLEGDLIGQGTPFEILPIVDDGAWREFDRLHMENWLEYRTRDGLDEARETGDRMSVGKREKSPPLCWWLGYVDGTAAGYFSSWAGIDGVGQVEYLFVKREYRHKGLATALIHHCVADARAHGAGPVVIVAGANDTPKHMYAAMGFRPVAVKQQYLLRS